MLSFLNPPKCDSRERLDGKTVVVTGCNTGIGKRNAADFYRRGARVVMACRNAEKAEAAKRDIVEEAKEGTGTGDLVVRELDLSSFASVRTCAEDLLRNETRIDVLVNNAGIMMCGKSLTVDGIERQLATNHLGHFLFTLLLLPKIAASAPSRIVNLSSTAHKWADTNFDDPNYERSSYSARRAYGRSKLANILFTKELARRLEGTGVTTYAVHPGVVRTEIGRHLDETYFRGISAFISWTGRSFLRTPEQGAQTTIFCAVDARTSDHTGLYYADCAVTKPSSHAEDPELAAKLWRISCDLTKFDDSRSFPPHPVRETSDKVVPTNE